MLITLDPSSTAPIYEQIAASIRGSIAAGDIAGGAELPATRTLAKALGVNMHTVLRAYGELRDDGIIELRQGRSARVVSGTAAEAALFHQGAGRRGRAWATTRHRTARGIVDPREGLSTVTGQPLPSSRRDRRRPAERSLALPVLIILAATPLLALASSPWLPARVASHYTAGVPDASSPVAVLVLIIVVVGVVPVLGWLALGRMLTLTPAVDAISFVALMSYAVIGVAGLTFGVIVANLGVPTWSQARSPQWPSPPSPQPSAPASSSASSWRGAGCDVRLSSRGRSSLARRPMSRMTRTWSGWARHTTAGSSSSPGSG
jgi:GntR family transcriptional regulator